MPAKKSGRSKSSAGASSAAKEADAAREAELQRHIAEREFLYDDESTTRSHLAGEESAALDVLRAEEADARHVVIAAQHKAHYEAREAELAAQLQQKEEALTEAQAAVARMQQASELLESDKASALRRVALLSNELELAQLNVVEAERRAAAADHEHQETLKTQEAGFDALQQRHHELEAKHAALEAQVAKTAEEQAASSKKEVPEKEGDAATAPPADAESAALLRVMQTEVERYKATAAQLQEEVTNARAEEEKSNLLVAVLNTQLESVREDNKRLHSLAQKHQAEVEAAAQLRREAQEARQSALAEMDQALTAAAVQQRQLQLESDVHRREAEKLTRELAQLRDEHAAVREELTHVSQSAAQQAQSDLVTNIAMQAELANQKKDLELALKAKATADDEKFHHKILTRAELDSLKTRLQRLQETMERKDREATETIAVLKADAMKRSLEQEQQSKEHEVEVLHFHAQLLSTLRQSEGLLVELETLQKSSTKREHELYEQLTSVTAYHAAAAEEAERLRSSAAQKDAEYTHNFVCLTAERENLKAKLGEVTEAAEQSRRTHAEALEKMREQAEELRSRLTTEAEAQQTARAKEGSRADLAERNIRRLQEHVKDLEFQALRGGETHGEAVKTLQAESRDLRSELSIAKRTIERLECALGDQASHRQLTELNDRLTRELEAAQRHAATLNGKVSLLQSEAETMGGYTVRKAQEEKEQLSRRLRQVEQRYRLMAPVFGQLRTFAASRISPSLNPDLYETLESFDQVSAFVASHSEESGAAAQEASKAERVAAPPAAADTVMAAPAVAAAADAAAPPPTTVDCLATLPAAMEPRPPSPLPVGAKARVTLRKPHATRSSIIVTGVNAPLEDHVRLPPIS